MTDRENKNLPDDEALERALGAQSTPEADGEFRRRLKHEFVSGRLDETGGRPQRTLLRVGLAAAVLLGAVLAAWFGYRGPGIEVFEVRGAGYIAVDGQKISVRDIEGLGLSLRPGAKVVVPETAELTLVVPGVALIELVGGTRMTLPSEFGRWFPRAARSRIDAGEVRILSGTDFKGRELTIHTPQGLAVVTGTLLSVQCNATGTCVCVLQGTVAVGVDTADLQTIPAGQRKVMLATGVNKIVPAAPPHRAGIRGLERRARNRFPR